MADKEPIKRSLATKLAEVMGEVVRVPKRGRNEFHQYDYATEADISDAVREGLASRHVILIPSVTSIERAPLAPSKTGGERTLTTVHVQITIYDGDSDDLIVIQWAGCGEDGKRQNFAELGRRVRN